jgi:hypothetical protein
LHAALIAATTAAGGVGGLDPESWRFWRYQRPGAYGEPDHGPTAYYDYGPGIVIGGPGIGFSLGID